MDEFNKENERLEMLYGCVGFLCLLISVIVIVLRIVLAVAN